MDPLYGQGRRFNRLPGYCYSTPGYYFVTVCTRGRVPWFGKITGGKMALNGFGNIAAGKWTEIPIHFPNVKIDIFIIMDDHVHGILAIDHNKLPNVGNRHACSLRNVVRKRQYQIIPTVVGSFKSAVARNIRQMDGGSAFRWQKSFHDRVIRNERELSLIREYVVNNAAQGEDGVPRS